MSATNEASPATNGSDLERHVSVRWKRAADFPHGDLRHRLILATGKNMPNCVGCYADGYFTLGDVEDHGQVFEGQTDWFTEHFDWWVDWPYAH